MSNALGVVAGVVAFLASLLAIRDYFTRSARIITPPHEALCSSKYVAMSGVVPWRTVLSGYWVMVQPSDCRDEGLWWPQHHPLQFDVRGRWRHDHVYLSRAGVGGDHYIGKTFTIALVQVPSSSRALVAAATLRGPLHDGWHDPEGIRLPLNCSLLHMIEVQRTA